MQFFLSVLQEEFAVSLLFGWDISKEFWNVKIAEESANRFLRKTFEFIAWFEYSIGSSKKQYFELKNIPQKNQAFLHVLVLCIY